MESEDIVLVKGNNADEVTITKNQGSAITVSDIPGAIQGGRIYTF